VAGPPQHRQSDWTPIRYLNQEISQLTLDEHLKPCLRSGGKPFIPDVDTDMLAGHVGRHQSEKCTPDHQIDREVLGPLGGTVEDITADDLVKREGGNQDQAYGATHLTQPVDGRPKTPGAGSGRSLFYGCLLPGLHAITLSPAASSSNDEIAMPDGY
jgi:hypothetical protein